MKGVGLDWIDFTSRPPSLQQQERHSQQQSAKARNQQGTQLLDLELA